MVLERDSWQSIIIEGMQLKYDWQTRAPEYLEAYNQCQKAKEISA
jgi:glycogen synthase